MYRHKSPDATNPAPSSAEEIAELTGALRRWASLVGREGDPRDAATIMSETLKLIGVPSLALPIQRLRDLIGPHGAQPRKRDAI